MFKNIQNQKPQTIGFLQAAGVSIYCALIASFFYYMSQTKQEPGFFGFFLILVLLVFSATITGSLVFGFSAYLAVVKNKTKEAFQTLAYTILFLLSFLIVATFLIALFS